MLKTKLFTGHFQLEGFSRRFIDVDTQINKFLEEENVEFVDIKLTTTPLDDDLFNTALLVYKESEKEQAVKEDKVFIVRMIAHEDGVAKDTHVRGAFLSFRQASEWLIKRDYEAFYNEGLSEILGEEIISFVHKRDSERCAEIDSFLIL